MEYSISFCPGLTTDDITGHEWAHAYTEYTDGLIYQWQPGALNEASSDIFGETLDRINGRGTDTPNRPRTAGSCSARSAGVPPPSLTVNAPAAIAGSYGSLSTVLHPPLPLSVTATVAAASPADACTAVTGVRGKIALIDWAGGAVRLRHQDRQCGRGRRGRRDHRRGSHRAHWPDRI